MALKERGRVKRLTASGGGTLTAPNHESFRVRGLFCAPSSSDTYLSLLIEGVNVGKFRVKGKSGNHCPYPCVKTTEVYEASFGGLLAWLATRGFALTFPVAAGHTLTVSRFAETGELTILYDAFDAGDVAPDEVNGPEATTRRYLHYLTNSAAITSTPTELDTSLIWTGGDDWPVGGKDIPHNTVIRVVGILGAPASRGNASANKGYTTYLTLLREGDVMFDDAQNGLPFVGYAGQTADATVYTAVGSVIGPLTAENPYPPLMFEEPIEFATGATLTPQVITSGAASGGLVAADLDVALILERVRS